MEKSAAKSKFKFSRRLLSIFLICSVCSLVFAKPSYEYMRSLSLRPMDDYIFTSTNTTFATNIRNLPPSDVDVYVNAIPNDVELVSVNKSTYIPPSGSTDTSYGTHVEVTVRFSKEGDHKLLAADLDTKFGYYKLNFDKVHVYANTSVLKPELSVYFGSHDVKKNTINAKVGDHIIFNVSIKYASSVDGITWELPENSIFREVKRYPIADKNQEGFSPEYKTVSTFDWQPLTEGTHHLPQISVAAVSYSGGKSYLSTKSISVVVSENATVGDNTDVEPLGKWAAAFREPLKLEKVSESAVLVGMNESEVILSYRKIKFAFIIFACFAVVFFGVAIIFVFLRKIPIGVTYFVICFLFVVCLIISGVRSNYKVGVFNGSYLYPIPEKTSAKFPLQTGCAVRILKDVGDWYYVSVGETNGWIKKEDIDLFEK